MKDSLAHAAETCARQVADALGAHLNIAATQIIERALREERERCASVADDCYAILIGHANHNYGEQAESLALDIARAIREGK